MAAEDRLSYAVRDSSLLPPLQGNDSTESAAPEIAPELERVLRIFPGIIMKDKLDDKE
jgi:hypothetical protein